MWHIKGEMAQPAKSGAIPLSLHPDLLPHRLAFRDPAWLSPRPQSARTPPPHFTPLFTPCPPRRFARSGSFSGVVAADFSESMLQQTREYCLAEGGSLNDR